MKDFNIVIVNYKTKQDIDKCLGSFYAQNVADRLSVAVNIVDNSGNIDSIKEMLLDKYQKVSYIDAGGNIGFGKAQNLGFINDKAKYYIALNPDIEFIDNKTLHKIKEFFEKNPRVGMIGPKLVNIDGSVQNSCYRFPRLFDQFFRRFELDKKHSFCKKRVDKYLMADFDRAQNRIVGWIMGSFMVARSEMTDEIGFFDDRFFMYFEDCDWCRRAWLSDWQVYYLADTVACHAHRRESSKGGLNLLSSLSNKMARIHLKSWYLYFKKWY